MRRKQKLLVCCVLYSSAALRWNKTFILGFSGGSDYLPSLTVLPQPEKHKLLDVWCLRMTTVLESSSFTSGYEEPRLIRAEALRRWTDGGWAASESLSSCLKNETDQEKFCYVLISGENNCKCAFWKKIPNLVTKTVEKLKFSYWLT